MILITSLMLLLQFVIILAVDYVDYFVIMFAVFFIVLLINLLYLVKDKNLKFIRESIKHWKSNYETTIDYKRIILITRKLFIFNISLILLTPLFTLLLYFINMSFSMFVLFVQSSILINGVIVGPVNYLLNKRMDSLKI